MSASNDKFLITKRSLVKDWVVDLVVDLVLDLVLDMMLSLLRDRPLPDRDEVCLEDEDLDEYLKSFLLLSSSGDLPVLDLDLSLMCSVGLRDLLRRLEEY